jgi:antitoxin VapB
VRHRRAKLVSHGGSQAVRLPKEFRFEGTEVYVRRVGNDVVLSAVPLPSVDALLYALADFEPGTSIVRGQPTLTPVRIQRGDAVRAKLAELGLTETDIGDAMAWARGAALQEGPVTTTRAKIRRRA